MGAILENLQHEEMRWILTILLCIFICIVGIKLTDWIVDPISKRVDKQALHWKFVKRAIKSFLVFFAIFEVFSQLPMFSTFSTTILTSSTVLVAAVGLASQESVANIISGMFISIFKPFAVGDRVKLISTGLVGMVEDINLRHTVIRTIENNRIIVPNTTMNKDVVENSNYEDIRICNFLDVKITYESNLKRAREIIEEEATKHPNAIDWRTEEEKNEGAKRVNVLLRDISNQCLELRAGIWTEDIASSFRTCSELRENLFNRFQAENIKLYYQTVRLQEE